MIHTLLEMIQNDFTFRVVSFGSLILGMISGALGCFAVLRKQSLIGDAISHCTLPGIAIAFLITNSKNIEVLLFGALISGLLSAVCIIRNRNCFFDLYPKKFRFSSSRTGKVYLRTSVFSSKKRCSDYDYNRNCTLRYDDCILERI